MSNPGDRALRGSFFVDQATVRRAALVQRDAKMLIRRHINNVSRLILAVFSCLLLSSGVFAQEFKTDSLPDAPSQTQQSSQTQQPATTPKAANPIQGGVEVVRLLQHKSLVFPDLATTQGPLTSWQKFKLAANNSVALSTIAAAAVGAAFSQAIDSPSGYHQGAEGYGKRFGADMARAASDNMFGTFLLASALHQDPRF
jgi:hypothetical protein